MNWDQVDLGWGVRKEQGLSNRLFVRESTVSVSPAFAFAWHERPGALQRLTPPWEKVRLVRSEGGIRRGAIVELRASLGPIPLVWRAVHEDFISGELFVDRAAQSPFALWLHRHEFAPAGDGVRLRDQIEWRLPLGWLGDFFGHRFAVQKLERMFAYRHRVVTRDLAFHWQWRERPALRVGIIGPVEPVAVQIAAFLSTGGAEVVHWQGRRVDSLRTGDSGEPTTRDPDFSPTDRLDAIVRISNDASDSELPSRLLQRLPDVRVWVAVSLARGLARSPAALTGLPSSSRFVQLFPAAIVWNGDAAPQSYPRKNDRHDNRAVDDVEWIALDDLCRAVLTAIRDDAWAGNVKVSAPAAVQQGEWRRVARRLGLPGSASKLPEGLQARAFAPAWPQLHEAVDHLTGDAT